MGSSLMAANQVKKLVKKAKLDITVVHAPVHKIPDSVDVVLVHSGLAKQAREKAPHAAVVPFQMFFNDSANAVRPVTAAARRRETLRSPGRPFHSATAATSALSLAVRTRLGEGSTFMIELPAMDAAPAEPPAVSEPGSEAGSQAAVRP